MSTFEDALVWITRFLAVVPAFRSLWHAVRGGDPSEQHAASLEMIRAMKDQQAREEIRP